MLSGCFWDASLRLLATDDWGVRGSGSRFFARPPVRWRTIFFLLGCDDDLGRSIAASLRLAINFPASRGDGRFRSET